MERAQNKGPGVVALGAICLFLSIVTPLPFFGMFLTGLFARLAARGATWAWVPTIIFGWIVVAELGAAISRGIGLPILFIAAGVLVFCHDSIWPPARKIGLIIVGILILAGLFGGDHDRDDDRDRSNRRDRDRRATASSAPATVAAPDLAGKTVEILTGEGSVRLGVGAASHVGSESQVVWRDNGTTVVAQASHADHDVVLKIPSSVAGVVVRTGSGNVDATGSWSSLTITTGSGAVDVEWLGEPTVELITGDGEIELHGYDRPDPEREFRAPGVDGVLKVMTGSGEIDLTKRERVLR